MVKRSGSEDRGAPAGTRTGPRARAAQERKFGDSKFRGPSRGDPYQRAERPARAGTGRDAPYGERLRAPVRSAGIALDPDVARVFRDSEAVNEALRLVIRLARLVGGGGRPAFNRDRPPSGQRSGFSGDRFARERPAPGGPRPGRPPPLAAKFDDAE